MTELNLEKKTIKTPPKPLSQTSVVLIRIAYDAITLIIAIAALFAARPAGSILLGMNVLVIYALVNALVLVCSIAAYYLVRRDFASLGMNVLTYSLIVGTLINAIFMERIGAFGLITVVFFTALSISQGTDFQKGIFPMATAILSGTVGLILDTTLTNVGFRIEPTFGMASVFIPTIIFSLIVIYVLGRQFPIFTLRAKMISSFVVVTILSLVLMVLFIMISVQSILTDEADQSLSSVATQAANSLYEHLYSYLQTVDTLAGLPVVYQFTNNPEETPIDNLEGVLNVLSTNYQYFQSYTLVNLNGRVLASSTPNTAGSVDESLLSMINSSIVLDAKISNVYHDPASGTNYFEVYAPVRQNEAGVIGVLSVRLDAALLQDVISRNNDLAGENSYAVIFDKNFVQLANGTNPEMVLKPIAPLDDDQMVQLIRENRLLPPAEDTQPLVLLELRNNLSEAAGIYTPELSFNTPDITNFDQINRGAVVKIDNTDWMLAFFEPRSNFLNPINNLGDISLFLLLLSGLFATGIGLFLTQVISKPITNLNETAARLTSGEFSARVEVQSQDEIGTLGNTFNMMAIQLQNLFGNLENQVTERTRDLQNQAAQLKAVAEIARDVTSEEELEYLLERTAFLVFDRFGYYHVGIYLLDQRGQYAVLTSSQDPIGLQLMANRHRFLIDTNSNVGLACVIGKTRKVSIHDPNNNLPTHPLLPNTQAQLTLPLRAGGKTIGAIDIHSANPRSFSEDETDIFDTFADQIAIAIQKIQFREEIQKTLNELETAYGEFTRESWRRFIEGRQANVSGYAFRQLSTETLYDQPDEVIEVWKKGESATLRNEVNQTSTMVIPMKVRGEVIGVLEVDFDAEFIPPDTQNLMTEISERLSLVMENARLIETAQKQVEQERLTTYLTDRIRQSLDLDTVLRTATEEIGTTLGLAEVEVRLGSMDIGLQVSGNGQASPAAPTSSDLPDEVQSLNDEDDYESTN